MRNSFVEKLISLAETDKDIFLLCGDLGFGALDKFKETFRDRFINVGICEQNMISTATGMALEGKKVFVYSIGNFSSLRCLEQIRNDCAYHNANVNIISVGSGLAYGALGMSHHATEDIAAVRALPNVTVFSPADAFEAAAVPELSLAIPGPCYIRLDKNSEKFLHHSKLESAQLKKAVKINDGKDICIFSTGSIIFEAIKAIESLKEKHVDIALYNFPTIKPIDRETISYCAKKYKLIISLEEHNILGGFGSAIAEVLSEIPNSAVLKMIGINDTYSSIVGDQEYLRRIYGICSENIEKEITKFLSD